MRSIYVADHELLHYAKRASGFSRRKTRTLAYEPEGEPTVIARQSPPVLVRSSLSIRPTNARPSTVDHTLQDILKFRR